MLVIVLKIIRKLKTIIWRIMIKYHAASLGVVASKDVVFYGWPVIALAPDSTIELGAKVVICSSSEFTALGVRQPCVLRTLRSKASLTIGEDTGISGSSICAALSVNIGRGCLIGAGVTITDTDFHPVSRVARRYCADFSQIKSSPVVIGDNVFIGTNAIILKGVKIGDHAVIGAGAVVSRDVGEGEIYGGNPARYIGLVKPNSCDA